MKNLLVFAHYPEAQRFLNSSFKNLNKSYAQVLEGPNEFVLICGEGPLNSLKKVSAFLGEFHSQISQIYNLGIMGTLNQIKLAGDVISIRTVYALLNEKPLFHSYTSSDPEASIDLVTTNKRVLDKKNESAILPMAAYVDCEAWGVFSAASLYSLPVFAFKITSDIIGDDQSCEDIKLKALEFSENLKEKYDLINVNNDQEHPTSLPKIFYATAYQLGQWKKLIKNLSEDQFNKFHSPKVFKNLDLMTKLPKERMSIFLEFLEQSLFPERSKIEKNIDKKLQELNLPFVKCQYDKNLEKSSLNLNVNIRSKKDIENLVSALEKFNYQKYQECFESHKDLHV